LRPRIEFTRAAVVGALFVASAAGCGSSAQASESASAAATAPSATVAASPANTAIASSTATFTSPLMGYTVTYPLEWVPTPATKPWTRDESNFWDDAVGDRMESPTAGFRGTSQPLARGQSPTAWLQEYLASAPACGDREEVAIGDQTGTIALNGCTGQGRMGGKVFDAIVVTGGRGYNFTMEGDVDHALFLAILKSVRFTPERAVDPPGPASPS
jgi:hypothetical protein